MASIRLNKTLREAAMMEIERRITTPELDAILAEVEAEARTWVQTYAAHKYPHADMDVLLKYECAQVVTTVELRTPRHDGRDYRTELDGVKVVLPITECRSYYHLSGTSVGLQMAEAVAKARREREQARAEKRGKYDAVVRACKTVDELIEVVPFLESVLLRKQAMPLSTLTQSLISEVREDATALSAVAEQG